MYALKKKGGGVFYCPSFSLKWKVHGKYRKIYTLDPDTFIHFTKAFMPEFP